MSSDSPLDVHLGSLQKGFELLALAATFLAGVQAQVMTITINTPIDQQTTVICLINAFFVMGLILDLVAAFLAFLTFRWLQRLSTEEKSYLKITFEARSRRQKIEELTEEGRSTNTADERGLSSKGGGIGEFFESWSALSLFIPMFFVVVGVAFMAVGIQIYIWTQQKRLVAILVTIAYVAVLPFIFGLFIIGKDAERRKRIIRKLSQRQGDW
ncbi:hypothetical protein CPB86DRAFT_875383 [Serendipita vermifera]|nr:hypothetical protein CPB86DRAFT_875383 [Serendipita vermifera]